MEVSRIIDKINAQIAKLQQARALLQGTPVAAEKPRRGRPRKNPVPDPTPKADSKGKRSLSPEARERIALAQKLRWAERRKP